MSALNTRFEHPRVCLNVMERINVLLSAENRSSAFKSLQTSTLLTVLRHDRVSDMLKWDSIAMGRARSPCGRDSKGKQQSRIDQTIEACQK